MNIYRQGDLLFYPLKEKPKSLKKVFEGNSYVLAYGEATGHKHTLVANPDTKFEILKDNKGRTYIKLNKEAEITHEEHKTIRVLPDFYVIHQEQEYDYPQQEIQRVQD